MDVDITSTGSLVVGLVGFTNSTSTVNIINCSVVGGTVSGTNTVGGLICNNSRTIIAASYYDSDTTGQSDTGMYLPGPAITILLNSSGLAKTGFEFSGWNHVVVTYDVLAPEARVYINNAAPVIRSIKSSFFYDASTFYLGTSAEMTNAGNAVYDLASSNARIAGIQVFNYVLDVAEVSTEFSMSCYVMCYDLLRQVMSTPIL